jgi:hypothetical protein
MNKTAVCQLLSTRNKRVYHTADTSGKYIFSIYVLLHIKGRLSGCNKDMQNKLTEYKISFPMINMKMSQAKKKINK